MKPLPAAIRSGIGLFVLVMFASGQQGMDPDPFDKDAFRSRKEWYLTYTLRLKGKGEVKKQDNMKQSITTTWDIHRELSGQAKLDSVAYGNGPADEVLKTPLTGARGERVGRFLAWTPKEWKGRSVSYRIHDLMRNEVLGIGEGGVETRVWEFRKVQDAGSLTFSDTGSRVVCDITDLIFDVALTSIKNGLGGGAEYPRSVKITGERHAGGTNEVLPPRSELAGPLLPHGNDELWRKLLGRKLELRKGRIEFSASVQVTKFPGQEGQFSLVSTEGGPPLDLSIDIVLSPGPPSRAKLILKPEKDYCSWRPLCSDSEEKPGNHLNVDWRVVEEGGDPSRPAKVKQVVFSLRNTSQLPGVCMNHPLVPKTPADFDLKFQPLPETLGPSSVEPDGQKLIIHGKLVSGGSGSITVDCFDSGATGMLVAEAELEDGRPLTAIVEGTGDPGLLIPDYEPGASLIATDWRTNRAPGKPDDADDEDKPAGDGKHGDGLTVWEEYRGFWVGGSWKEGDPAKKDFFVWNKCGAMAEPGVTKFETLSQLHVRRLEAGELREDQVINFNHAGRPHRVDQHGILIKSEPTLGDFCQAHNRFPGVPVGTPKSITFVGVGNVPNVMVQTQAGGKSTNELYIAPMLAHELFHCCNVYHHGEQPTSLGNGITWTKDAAGIIWEGAVKIRVLDSSGKDISGMVTFPTIVGPLAMKTVTLYNWQGLASGDVSCVMRYETGQAYIPRGAPGDRVLLLPKEMEMEIGGGLCTSPAATGTNLTPGRWGPCADHRGNCAGQIHVSDYGDAPNRVIKVIK
jgi:hypothetical protein